MTWDYPFYKTLPKALNKMVIIIALTVICAVVMVEDRPAGSVSEAITTVTGGSKPVHRFLRGQPKSIGVRHRTPSPFNHRNKWSKDHSSLFFAVLHSSIIGMYIDADAMQGKPRLVFTLSLEWMCLRGRLVFIVTFWKGTCIPTHIALTLIQGE